MQTLFTNPTRSNRSTSISTIASSSGSVAPPSSSSISSLSSLPSTGEFNIHAAPFSPSTDLPGHHHTGGQASAVPQVSTILEWGDSPQEDDPVALANAAHASGFYSSAGDSEDDYDDDEDYPGPYRASNTKSSHSSSAIGGARPSAASAGYTASPGTNIRRLAESFLSGVDDDEPLPTLEAMGGASAVGGKGASSRALPQQPAISYDNRSPSNASVIAAQQMREQMQLQHQDDLAAQRGSTSPSILAAQQMREQMQLQHQDERGRKIGLGFGQQQQHLQQGGYNLQQSQLHNPNKSALPRHMQLQQQQQQQHQHQHKPSESVLPRYADPSAHHHPRHSPPHAALGLGIGIGGGAGGQQQHGVGSGNTLHLPGQSTSPLSPTGLLSPRSPLVNGAGPHSVFRTSPLLDPSGYQYNSDREERMLHLEEVPCESGLLPTGGLGDLPPGASSLTPVSAGVAAERVMAMVNEKGGFEKELQNASSILVALKPTQQPEESQSPQTTPNPADSKSSTVSPNASASATTSPSADSATKAKKNPPIIYSASPSSLTPASVRAEDTLAFNLLHNHLVGFTKTMHTLQEQTLRMREELACRTRWAVRSVWPTAIVSVVGSVCAGVALPKSDLDFVVYFDEAAQEAARARARATAQATQTATTWEGTSPTTAGHSPTAPQQPLRSPSPLDGTVPPASSTSPLSDGGAPTSATSPSLPPFAHAGSLIKLIGGRKKSKLLFRSTKIQVFKDINLIRLRDGCSGISMDLWFPLAADIHRRSQQHTSLIHGYMSSFPAFYPLSCVVKTFMQQNLLNSGYSGLGSYGILLMIVRFLQHHRAERRLPHPVTGEVQYEEGNLGRLLCGFFRFYIAFDYEALGLDVREEGAFFDKAPLNELIREQQLREIESMRAEAEQRLRSGAHAGPKSVTATMNAATMASAAAGQKPPLASPLPSSSPPSTPLPSGSPAPSASPGPPPAMSPGAMLANAAAAAAQGGSKPRSQQKRQQQQRERGGGDDEDGSDNDGGHGPNGSGMDLDDPALLSHCTLVIQDPQDSANSIICHHKALRNMIHAFAKAVVLLDPHGEKPIIPAQAVWTSSSSSAQQGVEGEVKIAVPTTPGGTEVREITLPLLKQDSNAGLPSSGSESAHVGGWSTAGLLQPNGHAAGGTANGSPTGSPGALFQPPQSALTSPLARFHSLIDAQSAAQGPSQKVCPSSACKRAGPDGGPTMCPTQNKVCFTCGYMFVKPGVSTKHLGGNDRSHSDRNMGGSSPGGGNHEPRERERSDRQSDRRVNHRERQSSGSANLSVPPPVHLTTPGAAALAAAMAQQLRLQQHKGGAASNTSVGGFNAAQLLNFVTMQQRHLLAQQMQASSTAGGHPSSSDSSDHRRSGRQPHASSSLAAAAAARANEIAQLQQSVNLLVNVVNAQNQAQAQQNLNGGAGATGQNQQGQGERGSERGDRNDRDRSGRGDRSDRIRGKRGGGGSGQHSLHQHQNSLGGGINLEYPSDQLQPSPHPMPSSSPVRGSSGQLNPNSNSISPPFRGALSGPSNSQPLLALPLQIQLPGSSGSLNGSGAHTPNDRDRGDRQRGQRGDKPHRRGHGGRNHSQHSGGGVSMTPGPHGGAPMHSYPTMQGGNRTNPQGSPNPGNGNGYPVLHQPTPGMRSFSAASTTATMHPHAQQIYDLSTMNSGQQQLQPHSKSSLLSYPAPSPSPNASGPSGAPLLSQSSQVASAYGRGASYGAQPANLQPGSNSPPGPAGQSQSFNARQALHLFAANPLILNGGDQQTQQGGQQRGYRPHAGQRGSKTPY
jgi:hypothetical protein